jgi:hypothetical protein
MAITCDGFRLRCSGSAIDEGGNGMSAGLEVSLLVVAVWILIIGWSYCQVTPKDEQYRDNNIVQRYTNLVPLVVRNRYRLRFHQKT